MKKRKDKTLGIIGIITVLLICIAAALDKQNEGTELPHAKFGDNSPTGGKGLQLVLQRLGYTAKPVYEPQKQVPLDAKVWLILNPQTSFSTNETKQLLSWVRNGGLLIFCTDGPTEDYFNLTGNSTESSQGTDLLRTTLQIESTNYGQGLKTRPPIQPELGALKLDNVSIYRTGVKTASGSSYELRSNRKPMLDIAGTPGGTIHRFDIGTGHIFTLPDAWLFTNYGLAQDDNAILATNLITAHQKSGTVYFDERHHDNNLAPPEPDSVIARLKKSPYSTAIWQLFIGTLIFWIFVSRRLGSAVSLPVSGPVTRASLFAQAMGGLFQKVGRPKAAGTVIGDNFRRRLAKRVGLSPLESDEILARRTQELCGIPFETVDKLLLHSRAPSESEAAILRDAQEMERVLQALDGAR